jgi:hypothetical protein
MPVSRVNVNCSMTRNGEQVGATSSLKNRENDSCIIIIRTQFGHVTSHGPPREPKLLETTKGDRERYAHQHEQTDIRP